MDDKQGYAHLQRVMVGIAKPGSYIMEEAAKEIERLQAQDELARLREQLIDCTTSHQKANAEVERLDDALDRLRELLKRERLASNVRVDEAREAARQLLGCDEDDRQYVEETLKA